MMPQFTFSCTKQLRSRKHEAVENESKFNFEIQDILGTAQKDEKTPIYYRFHQKVPCYLKQKLIKK